MPKPDERQTLMFSATFPKEIQMLARNVFLKTELPTVFFAALKTLGGQKFG